MTNAAAPATGRYRDAGLRITLSTLSAAAPPPGPALLAFRFGQAAAVAQQGETVEIGIPLPVLDGDRWVERWHVPGPVRVTRRDGVTTASAAGLRLTAVAIRQRPDEPMEALGQRAYRQLLAPLRGSGWHLLRFWNFLPAINADEAGLERYRRFSLGRHQVFAADTDIDAAGFPAASALGGRDGPAVVLGLAARRAPLHLENPRQTSAYRYPSRYGPRSPSFARASWLADGDGGSLLVSGTASIVGHESRHRGDAGAQTAETVANLRHLLDHAGDRSGHRLALARDQAALRIYLRSPGDLPAVRRQLEREGLDDVPTVFLQADICRRELLMEIEGVVSTAAPLGR